MNFYLFDALKQVHNDDDEKIPNPMVKKFSLQDLVPNSQRRKQKLKTNYKKAKTRVRYQLLKILKMETKKSRG
jgi:hypothetical protein